MRKHAMGIEKAVFYSKNHMFYSDASFSLLTSLPTKVGCL